MPQHPTRHNQDTAPVLADVQTRDRHRLGRRLARARDTAARDSIHADILASREQTRARLDARGPIELTPGLPVTQRAEEITRAVTDNQVVVVCGETGSGKTTQLPKILMQAGLGTRGLIGHTQPRRLAARSVSQRVADELNVSFGGLVGYKTRMDDKVSDATQVKLMTDGILLAETAGDRFLNRYEAIILDEAHERTLNIDFLLGYIKRLLDKRPDLKLVVTSATIDPDRFATFFGNAPVINVEGRGYPVTVHYQPPDDGTDMVQAIEQGVHELWREGPGDILVFLPGERDIRDAERHLGRALANSKYAGAEIVPLYARLTRSAQNRVFTPGNGRRIVLATNVAETSLTVPGIHYVIDTGLARISRYSTRARVQRLPIEPVSQASCNQRAARCGRVAPGIALRLFSEADYDERPQFTDPEIRRTNLASVLLTMASMKLGAIDRFPFLDPPEHRFIRDGRNLLGQLQALHNDRITRLGRRLARLPLDPRIGSMLLGGDAHGVLPAVRVIAAGLTIQDPRERPPAAREQADEAHAPFVDKRSDFVSLLKLWDAFARAKRERSGNQLRKWCREHFVNFMRMREWEDLVRQLRRTGSRVGLSDDTGNKQLADCDYTQLHQALLPGLLDQFGRLDDSRDADKGTYLGARNRRFRIFPGSGVAGKTPRWIVAGQLVETRRLYAHTVALIEPGWLEAAAPHLVTREYYEPHWQKRRGHTAARERVKLFGQTLSEGRKVDYGRVEPVEARQIFIESGLVEGRVTDNKGRMPSFLQHNQQVVDDIAASEARFRRRDLLVDESTRAAFYDQALPADVRDRKTLQQYIKRHGDEGLRFSRDSLLRQSGVQLPEDAFPETLSLGSMHLSLTYCFEPGREDDGVTVRLPLPALNQFPDARADWLVPGLLEEKLREYLKALPKQLRRAVVPVPDFARALAERLAFAEGHLETAVRDAIASMTGTQLPDDVWQQFRASSHLRMRFEVIDDHDNVLGAGRNLRTLRKQLGAEAADTMQDLDHADIQQQGLTRWPDADLEASVEIKHAGVRIQATPALVDRGDSVDLELMDDAARARCCHRQGVSRLLQIGASKQAKLLERDLPGIKPLAAVALPQAPDTAPVDSIVTTALHRAPKASLPADLLQAVVADRIDRVPRDSHSFDQLLATVKANVFSDASRLWDDIKPVLEARRQILKKLDKGVSPAALPAVRDMTEQLEHLVFAGFISQLRQPMHSARHLHRYLRAIQWRLDKLASDGAKADAQRMRDVTPYWAAYRKQAQQAAGRGEFPEELLDFRWMVEEYRVQIFAQPLGTVVKVSPKRLDTMLDKVKSYRAGA